MAVPTRAELKQLYHDELRRVQNPGNPPTQPPGGPPTAPPRPTERAADGKLKAEERAPLVAKLRSEFLDLPEDVLNDLESDIESYFPDNFTIPGRQV